MPSASGFDSAEAIEAALIARAGGRSSGLFGPGTLMWRVARENVLLAGGPRALLMQLAHPAVSSGVTQHSRVADDPLGRSLRTFHAMYTLTFGDLPSALGVVRTVWRRHTSVVGHVTSETRSSAAGAPYRALDPELLAWVWATLFDTMVAMYETFVRKLGADDRAKFYDDAKLMQMAFGVPASAMPPTVRDHDAYVARMLRGPLLDVSSEARAQWERVLGQRPSAGLVGALMLPPGGTAERWLDISPSRRLAPHVLKLVAAGTLPPTLREAYGLTWTTADAAAFSILTRATRRALPLLPERLRYHAAYRRALARAGASSGVSRAA